LFNISYAAFTDMPQDHWAYNAVSKMEKNKILSDYPDGSFKPNQSITRVEAAQMLADALDLKPTAGKEKPSKCNLDTAFPLVRKVF